MIAERIFRAGMVAVMLLGLGFMVLSLVGCAERYENILVEQPHLAQ
jgi:hypothetical protein